MTECSQCKCWFHVVRPFKRGCKLCGTCTIERLRRDMHLVKSVNSLATQETLVALVGAIAGARHVEDVCLDVASIIDAAPDSSAWVNELKGWPCIVEKCTHESPPRRSERLAKQRAADSPVAHPALITNERCLGLADKVSVALWNLVPPTTAAAVRTIVIEAQNHRDVSSLSRTLPHAHVSMNIVHNRLIHAYRAPSVS